MNTTMYILAAMVIVSVVLIVYAFWPKPTDGQEAIQRRMSGRRAQASVHELRKQAKESVAKRVLDSVAPIAIRPSMKGDAAQMSKLRVKLSNAGLRGENAPTTFLASKTVMAVFLAVVAAGYVWTKGTSVESGIGIVMIGAGLGFLAPNIWLSSAVSKRSEKIRNGLPDTPGDRE